MTTSSPETTAPDVVLDAATAAAYARRIVDADLADRMLAAASVSIATAVGAAGHDRRTCRCSDCGLLRRISQHLVRQR